ncbi:MAG: hypothetical protein V7L13_19135 [Nostoc sp.]|uniref:hypothetical protein n=1 Tax=Nostoc sp. TaxID=1180 RepID=UPI002FF8ABC2
MLSSRITNAAGVTGQSKYPTVMTGRFSPVCTIINLFIVDAYLRRSITNHLSFFFVYATPVPRLTKNDRNFNDIPLNSSARHQNLTN